MTVGEFCLIKTQVGELCVLRECGYIRETRYIDHENLASMNDRIQNAEVKFDEWGTFTITTEHGDKIQIPCHYIDF